MDKAEYRIKLEQINSLAEAGDFKGAAAVVDTIDWRHVKSVRTLCMVGEIYEANKRYEDSKRVLQYAYKRSSISKTVLYRLAEINIRTGDYDEAKRYYHEFEQLSPNDTSRYILKYKLLKAEGAALDDQIAVLKEYKEREYTERWAYELAKLYMKNGQKQKCIEECDEMILWFAEGKYVTRAMELKMKLRSLSDSQKKKYNERYAAEEKESAEEAILEESMTADERISKAADLAVDEEEAAAQEADKGRKLSAAEMIHKMDIAADETVSSALSDDRTAPKPVTVPEEVEPVRVIEETVATEAAEEKAWEAMKSAPQTVGNKVVATAEETEEAAGEAAATTEETVVEAGEEIAAFTEEAAEAAEEAVEVTDEPAGAAKEAVEAAAVASAAKAAALARESAAQAGEDAAEEAAWKAQAEMTSGIAERKISAVQETEGAALADAEEEAAWKAAVARESAQAAAEKTAEIADGTDKIAEKAAEEAKAEAVEASETEKTAEKTVAETAETEKNAEQAAAEVADTETTAEEAADETVEIDWDIVDEDFESDAETEEESSEDIEEADAVEADEPEEEPVPLTPEEMAKNADEEAERALQEMMASFLNEFAVSGSEYKMTTDIIPDEDDVQGDVVPEKKGRDDREQMLGKETDESLGLTRTESFQEQLKKALEEGGNFEEASQIVISEELESPEVAAKRTVMTAHGLEYDPTAELEDEMDEEEAAEDEENPDEEVSEEAEESDDDEELTGEEEDNDTDDSEELTSDGDEPEDESEDESGEPFAEDTDSDEDSDETEGSSEDEADETESAEEEPEEEPEPEPVAPAPKILERVEVIPRKFTEEEEILFSYFTDIPGISQQATLALADIHNNAGDKTSKSGNVLIMGRQLSGKTRLADALICAACMDLNIEAAKVAKVIGEDLNDKDAAEIVDNMAGGFLLIEGAGSLSDEFVENLNKAMEFRTDSLVVILEDEKADLMNMLKKHEDFAKKFTSTIIIPVFTNDELVTFARTYANEQGYKLDEMGTLALYTMIGENQKDTEPVVVGKVKKMVDRAIERSKGPKIASLFRKNATAEDGRIWLREKDFRF